MSKRPHILRGNRRVMFGQYCRGVKKNARKGSGNYEQHLTQELAGLGGSKVPRAHWGKLCRYLGRVQ